ncbi:hypothetical protein JW960_09415 [candidate division KSB1 bacterium]|nr:hypothetical protein [candidate division KSB1 bacterium]
MLPNLIISPGDNTRGGSGGGPDDDSNYLAQTVRVYGFSAIAFGFALGLTFLIFFGLFRLWGAPSTHITAFVSKINPNLWLCFIAGFVGGTLISGIYNLLMVRRINLFGL